MPAVGGRYILFLSSLNNQDLLLLTAYRLGPDGIAPLDDAPQFEKFRGTTEEVFLKTLDDSLTAPSPN
jgi:hypothetical protein